MSKKEWLWAGIIVAVAAIVRIIYWMESGDNPLRGALLLDAKVYHLIASEIATQTFWGSEIFFRAPLFSYLLGMTYKLFGVQQTAITFLQLLMGVATAFLAFLTARRWLSASASFAVGLATALYPTLYYVESEIMPTTLEVFAYALTLFLFSLYDRGKNQKYLFWGGVSLGFAALARPTILTFALTLVIWLHLIHRNSDWLSTLRRYLLIVLGMAIVILPCTLRNYIVGHELVLISSQGGVNFYMGNNKDADGQTAAFPTISPKLDKYQDHIETDSKALAQQDTRRNLTAGEVSSYWMSKGMSYFTTDPVGALGLFFKKVYLVFCGEELFNNEDPLAGRQYAHLYSAFIWSFGLRFPYGLLTPLCLVGSFLLLRRKKTPWLLLLFIYSQAITVALFFVSSRYRQPLIPAMIIIAIAGVYEVRELIKSGRLKLVIRYAIAAVVLLLALNPPVTIASKQNESMYHTILGNALALQNQNDQAVAELKTATTIDNGNTLAYYYLGMVYGKTQKFDLALDVLKQAEKLNPTYTKALLLLSRVYFEKGEYDSALVYFNKLESAELDPNSAYVAYRIAAQSSLATGKTDDAKIFLDRILKLQPGDQQARSLLDSLQAKK